jgi:hypothetical protein
VVAIREARPAARAWSVISGKESIAHALTPAPFLRP